MVADAVLAFWVAVLTRDVCFETAGSSLGTENVGRLDHVLRTFAKAYELPLTSDDEKGA